MNLDEFREGWFNLLKSSGFEKGKPTPELQKCIEERRRTCMGCPHLVEKRILNTTLKLKKCDKCGCAFPAMIYAYGKRCPDGRWDVVPKTIRQKKE